MSAEPPVFPGDMLLFHVSGNRLLVVHALAEDGGKQAIGGLLSTSGKTCELVAVSLLLAGCHTFWSIERPVL